MLHASRWPAISCSTQLLCSFDALHALVFRKEFTNHQGDGSSFFKRCSLGWSLSINPETGNNYVVMSSWINIFYVKLVPAQVLSVFIRFGKVWSQKLCRFSQKILTPSCSPDLRYPLLRWSSFHFFWMLFHLPFSVCWMMLLVIGLVDIWLFSYWQLNMYLKIVII